MSENVNGRFDFTYENCASFSYIVVNAGKQDNILWYQVSMLENNSINRIAPFEIKRKNGVAYFYYNISSKLSLSFFLKRKKLKRNDFIKILADIARNLVDSAGYLLTDSSFVIDAEYIYINPDTLEILMIYLPVASPNDIGRIFKDFVIELILHHVNIDECGSDNFLQRILAFVKGDVFNLTEFLGLLDILLYNPDSYVTDSGVQDEKPLSTIPEKSLTAGRRTKEKRLNERPVAIVILTQVLIAALIIICRKFLNTINSNSTVTYVAALMVVLAVDILLFKFLFSKKLIIVSKKPDKPDKPDKSDKPDKPDELNNSVQNSNTMLLGSMKRGIPVLWSKNAGSSEEIVIDKTDFVIGRLAGQVDYVCSNNAVGKVHAQIISRGGSCYVKDLNSINGTFVNNCRIESNKECEIKDNDSVMFANNEYLFTFK